MSAIVLLFVIGLLLLGFEVFLPGGILGAFGGLALLAGCAIALIDYGATGGLLAFAIAGVLAGGVLYFEFRILPQTAFGRRLFLKASIDGRSAPPAHSPELVGQTAQAVTPLAPSGYVSLNGRRYEAYSQSGYLPAGAALRVVGQDNFRLIVTQA